MADRDALSTRPSSRRYLILELGRVDRINALLMVSPHRDRSLNLANRAWMALFEHLRSSTVITRILYQDDFTDAWSSCRLVCREWLPAVGSTWIEVCRLFVVQRCRQVTGTLPAHGDGW